MSEQQEAVSRIDEKLVRVGVQVPSREALITEMGIMLVEQGFVKPSYIPALLAREEEFPTGIAAAAGVGVAIPHSDAGHVLKTAASVWVLDKSIPFHVMGGGEADILEVNIVFMLAVHNPQEHLMFLQKLLGLFSKEGVMLKLRNAPNAACIAETINLEL